jgi:oligoribonuclease
MKSDPKTNLVWIDTEFTGLNTDIHKLIEIAVIVTNKDLEIVADGPVIQIHQPPEELSKMDEWHVETHGKSGLLDKVKASKYSEKSAEEETLNFIKEHVAEGLSPLCGNSVSNDKRFLIKYMPKLDSYLHYRLIDVTTLKELYRLWVPDAAPFKKTDDHRAHQDIVESIEELKFYREVFLKL